MFFLISNIYILYIFGKLFGTKCAFCPKKNQQMVKNIARSQMAVSNTSHRLLRCQVVLNKRLFVKKLFFWLEFDFLSVVTIWVVEFCHNLSCWMSSYFEFLKFVKLWVEFYLNSSCWVYFQFKLLSFVTNSVFKLWNNFIFWFHNFS